MNIIRMKLHLFLVIYSQIFFFCKGHRTPKIAIIGGGIGGTSAAYFLSDTFKEDPKIDLYEKDKIGGRLASVDINNINYEIGGTVIHPRNEYMQYFAQTFSLDQKSYNYPWTIGLYDGKFLFKGNPNNILNLLKLIWQYGVGVIWLNKYIEDTLSRFSKIYKIQEEGKYFEKMRDLIEAIDPKFTSYLNISTYDGFINEGFSKSIINQLIHSTLKCNYGQTTSVHKFVGAVSVAGAGSGLWKIKGGNKKIAEKLLVASNAKFYNQEVIKIQLTESFQYNIYTSQGYHTYDAVVLALPITDDHQPIEFEGFETEIKVPGKYHQTVTTIIFGKINNTFFGFSHPNEVPNFIINIINPKELNSGISFFNTISQLYGQSDNNENMEKKFWKVFSNNILSNSQLGSLFSEFQVLHSKDWKAYPEYVNNNDYNFILHNNLYHINAIEWAASAMEMSVIGAKNVALLLENKWIQKEKKSFKSKDEL